MPAEAIPEAAEKCDVLPRADTCTARAVYVDADVYLFADPLSAPDAYSPGGILKCILRKGVLRKELRPLITRPVHLLPLCSSHLLDPPSIAPIISRPTPTQDVSNFSKPAIIPRKLSMPPVASPPLSKLYRVHHYHRYRHSTWLQLRSMACQRAMADVSNNAQGSGIGDYAAKDGCYMDNITYAQ